MKTPDPLVIRAADRLATALRTATPAAPVRDLLGRSDVARAYAVQAEVNARRVAAGAVVSGRKIGLTSRVVQAQLGVDQPDFGVLFAETEHRDGSAVALDALIQPKVEAEVAFVLSADLDHDLGSEDDPGTGRAAVRAAIGAVLPAIEIVDSRVAEWDITIVDTVADNGSAAAYVLGTPGASLAEVEPRDVTMSMTIDGVELSTGTGSACLGDPLDALLWLARTARAVGDPLRAGQVILSGALGPMVPVQVGQSVVAEISGLGRVSVTFVSSAEATLVGAETAR